MKRIRKNDEVIVIAGKDKGRQGKILQVKDDKVIVESVNTIKKTVKPNPNTGEKGGIKEQEQFLHISNVMLINSVTKKKDKVGFRIEDDAKIRHFKSNGERIN